MRSASINSPLKLTSGRGFDVDGVQAIGTQCEVPQVPEFGLVTGLLALAGSAGSWVFVKKKKLV